MNIDVKKVLYQYPYIEEDIKRYQDKLNEYILLQEAAKCPLGAQNVDGLPRGNKTSNSTLESVIRVVDEYQKEIDYYGQKINECIEVKRLMNQALEQMNEYERRVYHLKYEKNMSNRKIGYEMRRGKDFVRGVVGDIEVSFERKLVIKD